MPFVHRHLADKEIYWVKNPTLQALKIDATFRVAGKKPQIYHPEDGRVEDCSYVIKDGKTVVTLNLVSEDAVFVVFEGTATENKVQLAEAEEHTMQVVDGPWEVAFEEGRGAPKTATFTELSDFSENENEGIKYFSGKATYTKTIVVDKKQLASAGQVLLGLGKVCVMAEVFVNGQNMGVAWKAPFKLDITSALKPGKNDLKIIVTNLWVNRLIGDAQPGVEKKITYTSLPFYQANAPLQPSGMMGPVKLIKK
jgi:ketosteroid isomerase-like protein